MDGKPHKDPIASIKKLGDNVVPIDSLLFHTKNNCMYPNYTLEVIPNQEHSYIVKSKELLNLVFQKSID